MASFTSSISPPLPASPSVTATTVSSPTAAAHAASSGSAFGSGAGGSSTAGTSVSAPQRLPAPLNAPPPGPGPAHGGQPRPARGSAATTPSAATATTASSHIQPTLPSASTQRQVAEARAALVASIGNMLDRELQGRAAVLHANAAAIARQERDVERAAAGLRRENDRLGRAAADAARGVKETGNVQNWAELLERDFLVLEETVRLARRGGGGGSGSGSGSGSWSGSSRSSWSGSGSGSGSEAGDAGGERDAEGDVRMGGDGGAGGPPVAGGGGDDSLGLTRASKTQQATEMDVDPAQVPLPEDSQSFTEAGSSTSGAEAAPTGETTTLASTSTSATSPAG